MQVLFIVCYDFPSIRGGIPMKVIIRKPEKSDVGEMAKVHVDSWKTTYKGIVAEEYLQTLKYENREKLWAQALSIEPRHIWVAEVQNKVVGFASGGKERTGKYGYDGELYAIYILEEFQQKGIGKSLLRALADELSNSQYKSMLVWVIADNPSISFYQSLNPIEVDHEQVEIGRETYKEIAYGWSDITKLLN
jgi:L-amino acid N-acyltransferase YncA